MPAISRELQWGQDNPIEVAPELSAEEKHILEKKKEAFDKLLAAEGKAKYKIEVLFAHTRRAFGDSVGALSIWESGTKLHGGGDTKMYWCPGKELRLSDCTGFIPDASNGYGHLVCPRCQKVWSGDQVFGEIFYRFDSWKWAQALLKHYASLDHNADIYLKYPKHDLRVASRLEQAKQMMGEKLAKVRTERQQYIYPLNRIIKDVSAGSDLLTRFHAFLTA